jgi:hypothetical protein
MKSLKNNRKYKKSKTHKKSNKFLGLKGGSPKNELVLPELKKFKSFKPRMYQMKIKISKKNRKMIKNNMLGKLGNLENKVSFNTIGSYVENKK